MDAIELLQALVRIPSPNPPGDTQTLAMYIAQLLEQAGCRVQRLAPPSKPEALSVVASVGQGDPVIMLHAHIDTVPIAVTESHRWQFDPYAAEVHEGKLYGKGSIDDKAPLAAMMLTLLEAASDESRVRGTLVLVAAAEEEVGGQLGTRWLADHAHLPKCDFIVVGEQTHNRVANAHKGVMRATIQTLGKAVHATNPDRGVNAITAMARIVLALESYHHDLAQRQHPTVGVPTCNVGVIEGGSTANAVPDRCVVRLDRRVIPREDPAHVQAEIQAVVAAVDVGVASAAVTEFLYSSWFDSSVTSSLASKFFACVQEVLRDTPGPVGYLPGSDAKHLMTSLREGGEIIIFGPGSYEVAHAFDEHVVISEYLATITILKQFLQKTLLG